MSTSVAASELSAREVVGMAAGVVGCLTVIAFGFYLLYLGESQNIAGWGTIAALDALIFYNTLKTNSDSAWLSGGYTIGATLVTLASLYNGAWHWGIVETIETVGVIIILALRTRLNPQGAIIAGMVVMVVGTIPLMHDYWFTPFFPSWWMWGIGGVCDFVALFATRKWSVEDSLFPGVGGILSFIMTALALR